MADKSFIIVDLILRSGRFGRPRAMARPYGGILGTTHHNTATAIYPIGTVIELWNSTTFVPGSAATDGSEGWSEFVYGQGDVNAGNPFAALQVAVPKVLTQLFDFTNDPDDSASLAAAYYGVVALSAITNDYYGWWWSGGVCPADHVVAFASAAVIATTTAADITTAGMSVSAQNLAADAIGLGVTAGTTDPIGTATIAAS